MHTKKTGCDVGLRLLLLLAVLLLLFTLPAFAAEAAPAWHDVVIHVPATAPFPEDNEHCRIDDVDRVTRTVRATVDATGEAALLAAGCDVTLPPARPTTRSTGSYLTFSEVEAQLAAWEQQYPARCTLSSAGLSAEGRKLRTFSLGHPASPAGQAHPSIRIMGGIHGNELVGTDLCMRLARYLLEDDAANGPNRALLDATDVLLMPVVNPDGMVRNQRGNLAGADLNRSFPCIGEDQLQTAGRQVETAALMNWTMAAWHSFHTGLHLHSGSLGVAYPWGHSHDYTNMLTQNPETALFRQLSFTYTAGNANMWNSTGGGWVHGTINGCQWYPVDGEWQDWSYRCRGILELTVELNYDIKAPATDGFAYPSPFWDANSAALLASIRAVHGGVRGTVRDSAGTPLAARLSAGRRPDDGSGTTTAAVCFLHLQPGWNLVALPIEPDTPVPDALFPQKRGFCWGWRQGAFCPLHELHAGDGFWVYHDAAATTLAVSGRTQGSTYLSLNQGWNLLGALEGGTYAASATVRQVYSYDAVAKCYTAVPPGAAWTPGAGCWVYAGLEDNLDFAESANRPCPSVANSVTGFYQRVLMPGTYEMWFEDVTAPALQHTPPTGVFTAGQDVTLSVSLTMPAAPVQYYGVQVEPGKDALDCPNHSVLDVTLPVAQADTATVTWSGNGGGTWNTTSMNWPAGSGTAAVTLGTSSGQTALRYYFTVQRGNLTLGTWQSSAQPFVLPLKAAPAVRTAVMATKAAPAPVTTVAPQRIQYALFDWWEWWASEVDWNEDNVWVW